jgi:hypothetical protein
MPICDNSNVFFFYEQGLYSYFLIHNIMSSVKAVLLRHRNLLVISVAVIALASYMLPIDKLSVPASAQSGKYGGQFPGKGNGVSGQPGQNGQPGNFPHGGNSQFPGKGNGGGGTGQ